MIQIHVSTTLKPEFEYMASVLFGEFLGLSYELIFSDGQEDTYLLIGEKKLIFHSAFWWKKSYLDNESLPAAPLMMSNEYCPEDNIPVFFGTTIFTEEKNQIYCGADLFAMIFFMLSRWEELVVKDRDGDSRFSAMSSFAYKNQFLDRPIVDEYVIMLRRILTKMGVENIKKSEHNKWQISCDVDHPFDPNVKNIGKLAKTIFGDLIKRKNPALALKRCKQFIANKRGDYRFDTYYTFQNYLELCAKYNHSATFYFISDSSEARNGSYRIEDREVLKILKKIHLAGHQIGLHASYQSYNNPEKLKFEKKKLENALLLATGESIAVTENRQHYLRYEVNTTPDFLDQAGFLYDSTGGFADRPGFRFGTANTFSMWSWQEKRKLKLKQKPLILMECTVLDQEFLNLGLGKESEDLMLHFKKKALQYGCFTLLWHNSHFQKKGEFELFELLLKEQ